MEPQDFTMTPDHNCFYCGVDWDRAIISSRFTHGIYRTYCSDCYYVLDRMELRRSKCADGS